MHPWRLVLVLLLAAVMDLGSPVLREAAEVFQGSEEAALGRRRLPRLAQHTSPARTPAGLLAVPVTPPAARRRRPLRPLFPTTVRKTPPPAPSSASDDH